MSKSYKASSVGFDLVFNGPASVEEYDQLAGRIGAALEDAVRNEIYRGTLPEFQRQFAEKLEALTGVTRAVNEKATAEAKARSKNPENVSNVLENVAPFVKRAVAAYLSDKSGEELVAAKAELQALAQSVADTITIDPSPSSRTRGASKSSIEKAESWLETLDSDAIEAKVAKLTAVVPNFELTREDDGRPEKVSLARLIDAFVEASL